MTITSSTQFELLEPGLRAIFGTNYDGWKGEYEQIFDIEKSNRKYEEYLERTGFGVVPVKDEGADNIYDNAIQGYKTTLTNLTYSLGFKVTREMHEDDQYREINNMPEDLAMSVKDTMEILGANVLNNAFDSAYAGADGSALCSTSHSLPGGGTSSNAPSTPADLSTTSYNQGEIDISGITDGRGKKIKVLPKKLIVTPTFSATAKRIIDSPEDPETSNRSINPHLNAVSVHVNHYLDDPDAWFLITNQKGLVCQMRVEPEFRKDNDFDSDVQKFKTYFRTAFGFYDWRMIYGSAGA